MSNSLDFQMPKVQKSDITLLFKETYWFKDLQK